MINGRQHHPMQQKIDGPNTNFIGVADSAAKSGRVKQQIVAIKQSCIDMGQAQNLQNSGLRPQTTSGNSNYITQGQQNIAGIQNAAQKNPNSNSVSFIKRQKQINYGTYEPAIANGGLNIPGQIRTTNGSSSDVNNETISSNIKEIMNTSAPICISNYVKNGATQQQMGPDGRPSQSHGGARRQTSGNINGVRRAQVAYNTQPILNMNDLGIISGQTMNLNRAQTRDGAGGRPAVQQFKLTQNIVSSVGTNKSFENMQAKQRFNGQRPTQGKQNEEDGFMRGGARIADKIQEFYQTGTGGLTQTNQTVSNGVIQIQHAFNGFDVTRQDITSQGGMRANGQKQLAIAEQNNAGKRSASAYGNAGGQRRNLNLNPKGQPQNAPPTVMILPQPTSSYKQQVQKQQMISNRKILRGDESNGQMNNSSRPISRDSKIRNNQQVNNFFGYSGNLSAATQNTNYDSKIPRRQSQFNNTTTQQTVYPGSLASGIGNYTEDNTQLQQYLMMRNSRGNEVVRISDVVTNGSQDARLTMGMEEMQMSPNNGSAIQEKNGQTTASSSDIRQIKLNYLQLNKRQTSGVQQQAQKKEIHEINPLTNVNENMERHPLDKAQIYKQDGAPSADMLEFCTHNSTIDNLDNYIIGKRIGAGAYAVVRLGLHKQLNQKIGVKIYEKVKLLEPNRRKSVKREMKIMEKLDHPNIAKLYEVFESYKQVFMIMEYVNGGSLHGYLKMKPNRQMPELEAKFLWVQVVQSIYYCHQRNVTHRDIKLENILLDETKTVVKLIDFGFSTCIPHERKVKIFCGTPSYMAPEIVSKIEYSGPPADIWALGVLLYALLCGKFPFKGANDKELYQQICTAELQFPDHLSVGARKFFTKLFQKDPSRRPTTKEILRDPWCDISAQELEMLSPRHALGFVSNNDMIDFERSQPNNLNSTQKVGQSMSSQGQRRTPVVINPQNINFANGTGSKDKRLTMFPEQIKRFIVESNNRKGNLAQDKSILQMATKDLMDGDSCINRNTINIEAYNAYYNNDQQPGLEGQHSLKQADGKEGTKIINNIMHINHSGANINITAAPNCQNNFIFNHTAPINLNFYKDQQKGQQVVQKKQFD